VREILIPALHSIDLDRIGDMLCSDPDEFCFSYWEKSFWETIQNSSKMLALKKKY